VSELDDRSSSTQWLDVGEVADVIRRRKFVVGEEPDEIVVVCHEGNVYALQNICIHKGRELGKGVVLRDRLVCPGHQWSFDLRTGWESVKEQCQPTYAVRITDDDRVEVDLASRTVVIPDTAPTEALP
jgi:nitrite reductase (NADH) small subunit